MTQCVVMRTRVKLVSRALSTCTPGSKRLHVLASSLARNTGAHVQGDLKKNELKGKGWRGGLAVLVALLEDLGLILSSYTGTHNLL